MQTWQKLKKDPSLWDQYFVREKTIKALRLFFDAQNFHEVETPTLLMHPPAESYVEVFETILLDRKRNKNQAYLSTSPEVALKKLLVAGIGNCYSITKSFRNTEGESDVHQPEFTILEWYRVGADYKTIMTDCEKLLLFLIHTVQKEKPTPSKVTIHKLTKDCLSERSEESRSFGFQPQDDIVLPTPKWLPSKLLQTPPDSSKIVYQNQTIDLMPPWPRMSVKEAFQHYANVDLETFFTIENAQEICKNKGYTVTAANTWEELYNQIFLNEIEPYLGKEKPIILYDFPSCMAALAKKREADPRYAERFEFYIGGLELGDCYTELTDWQEQKSRFDEEIKEIKRLGKTSYDYDHDFIEALKIGLPPSSGIAIGVDRLIMLLANVPSIQDILFFPLHSV